jgi:hypothetical protein
MRWVELCWVELNNRGKAGGCGLFIRCRLGGVLNNSEMFSLFGRSESGTKNKQTIDLGVIKKPSTGIFCGCSLIGWVWLLHFSDL